MSWLVREAESRDVVAYLEDELRATRNKLRTKIAVAREGKTELQTLIERAQMEFAETRNAMQQIAPLVAKAARTMLDTGIRDVRNQGVILNGVNADPHALLDLCFRLLDGAQIMPYYFYMCDMIPFSEHWRVSLADAQRLPFVNLQTEPPDPALLEAGPRRQPAPFGQALGVGHHLGGVQRGPDAVFVHEDRHIAQAFCEHERFVAGETGIEQKSFAIVERSFTSFSAAAGPNSLAKIPPLASK